MGLLKEVRFKAGIVAGHTDLTARPHWTDSDRMRFIRGRPHKIGGWIKYISTSFVGKARGMIGWADNTNELWLAFGTNEKLYAVQGDDLYNITPLRDSGTLGLDPFTTTASSMQVSVAHTAHGVIAGDHVFFTGATAVGGITIDGEYTVTSVTDANTYVITHSTAATSSATGGGAAVDYEYEINIGAEDGVLGRGWGVGGYGQETYGTPRSTFVLIAPRIWTIDQWGQNIVAAHINGNVYDWTRNTAARAQLIANAPTGNLGIFITEEQHLVVYGAGGVKMRIDWSDQSDYTTWTPSDQNTAGSRTLTGGSKIVGAIRTRGTNLVLTDSSVWAMTFLGGLDVFGFRQLSAGSTGLRAQHAICEIGGVVYWMGIGDFYYYDGVIRTVPNSTDIRDFVLDNIDDTQADKIFCSVNSAFHEIWWFYPTSGENSRYVKFNYFEKVWDVGALSRTTGIDIGLVPNPILAGGNNFLYQHETGTDDDGSAMNEYIVSAPFMIGDGNRVVEVLSLQPDIGNQSGSVHATLLTRYYPQDSEEQRTVGEITTATTKLDVRASGRVAKVQFAGQDAGTNWNLGVVLLEMVPGGER